MTYGPGLLNSIPCDCVETKEQKLALLDEFARKGFIMEMYEVIDDAVVKFVDGVPEPKDAVLYEWVEDEDKARRVKELMKRGGSKPYSYASFLDGFNMLVPDVEAHGNSKLVLADGSAFKFSAMPIPTAIREIKKINEKISGYEASYWEGEIRTLEDYLEFHNELIRDLTACMEEGVIYLLS